MTMPTNGPLSGLKILDFTQLLQGPYATQMLGDLGADIIKIEKPGTGDLMRQLTLLNGWLGGKESPCYLAWNRNKRSLALDLKSSEGKEIIYKLAATCDIVVENFRPGVMDRLGFSFEKLHEINPRLIYCSSSGWGSDGPYVTRPGQDLLVQGLAGVLMQNGQAHDPPVPVGTALSDQLGALHIVYGVLAALYSRERSGRGQKIETSLFASTLAFQSQEFMTALNLNRDLERPRSGIGHPGALAPQGVYRTKDGWITIAMNPWKTVVQALGDPSLLEFGDPTVLFERRDEIWARINQITRTKPTQAWLDIMFELDLWAAEIKRHRELPDDPQARHLKMFTTYEHPVAGTVKTLNIPLRFSETPGAIRMPPPLVGQHGPEILDELGYSEPEIENLIDSGVLFCEPLPSGEPLITELCNE